MPNTPIYGLPFETPQSKPGITITGDSDGSAPILAEAVEAVLASFESRLTAIETTGFRLLTTLYLTTVGTEPFTKASYNGFKAARVRTVGGGGGGGGAAVTAAGQLSMGSGGGGACYAESFLLDAAIPSSLTITTGAGGAGGVGVAGSTGATSSFGVLVTAAGGGGGATETTAGENGVPGGTGGTAGTGQLIIPGSDGNNGRNETTGTVTESPNGGSSFFGGERVSSSTVAGANGFNARNFGSGGSGGMNDANEADVRNGGAGSGGLVIVEVFI